jgi:hypothetical protein
LMALEHPLYFPDFSLPDIFPFRWLKPILKVQHFTRIKEVTAEVTRALTEVSKNDFQESFQSFTNTGKSVSLAKGTTSKEIGNA